MLCRFWFNSNTLVHHKLFYLSSQLSWGPLWGVESKRLKPQKTHTRKKVTAHSGSLLQTWCVKRCFTRPSLCELAVGRAEQRDFVGRHSPEHLVWGAVFDSSWAAAPESVGQLQFSRSSALSQLRAARFGTCWPSKRAPSHRLFDVGLSRGSSNIPLFNIIFGAKRPIACLQLRARLPSPWIQRSQSSLLRSHSHMGSSPAPEFRSAAIATVQSTEVRARRT